MLSLQFVSRHGRHSVAHPGGNVEEKALGKLRGNSRKPPSLPGVSNLQPPGLQLELQL